MSEAVWRGNRVPVVRTGVKTAVIVTPLGYKLCVSVHELRTVSVRTVPKYRPPDANKLR